MAGYFIACVNKLSQISLDTEIHIIRWTVNKEAPFDFSAIENVFLYDRDKYTKTTLAKLIKDIDPSIIYCSGWMDKAYKSICKTYTNKIPVIVGMDNKWTGSFKQKIARLVAKYTVLKCYNYCWVPGEPQEEYALKLGFKKNQILTGFYSADIDFFNKEYFKYKENKMNHLPRRFIYVGRYYSFKGVQDLWKAFDELHREFPNDWELWCLGVGDLNPFQHSHIKHFGFIQPADMSSFIKETSVFVLPSHFEPWGVVVHEFAAAGFPIVCSNEVGAATQFVENDVNGFIFPVADIQELKKVLKKTILLSNAELIKMGEKSLQKANQISPEKWANKLMRLLN